MSSASIAFMGTPGVRKPPGPLQLPFVGSLLDAATDRLGFMTRTAKLGDLTYFRVADVELYLANHPEYIKKVLVDDDAIMKRSDSNVILKKWVLGESLLTTQGEQHKQLRKMSAPAFSRKNIHSYAQIMTDLTTRHLDRLGEQGEINLHAEMNQLTATIVARALFTSIIEDEVQSLGDSLHDVMEAFKFSLAPPFERLLEMKWLPMVKNLNTALDQISAIINRFVDEHLADEDEYNDFLSMLIRAKKEQNISGEALRKQLREETMTIFLAGHETTANALTWTWYQLLDNPLVLKKLVDEVDEVLAGRAPTLDDLANLTYTRKVLAESMRLFPPAWTTARVPKENYELGGFVIPAGAQIMISQWVTHRDARFWPNPERFDPGRFDKENVEARHKLAYFPFGAGARNCIGEQFAWQEGIIILAMMAQRFRFARKNHKPVIPEPLITLRPKGGLPVTFQARR